MDQDEIVAIGLLSRRDLELLGPAFRWAWPVEDVRAQDARNGAAQGCPTFDELLAAIDLADEELKIKRRVEQLSKPQP